MKSTIIKRTLLSAIVSMAFGTQAFADHNSVWGEGWANMPNDIHNTVVEGDLSGSDFMEFISGGAGADSVNRYADDTNGNSRSDLNGGSSNGGRTVVSGGSGNGRGGRR